MTVSSAVIGANRPQLRSLIATNFFGQNSSAIAATEADGYTDTSAAASTLTAFTEAPSISDRAGAAGQATAATQAGGSSVASLSQLITTTLRSLASPSSSTSSGSGLSKLLSELLTGSSSTTSTPGLFGGISGGSVLETMISEYRCRPGFFGLFMATDALAPAPNTAVANAATAASVPGAASGGAGASACAGNAAAVRYGSS
jgi:PPE-repeat protein